MQRCSVSICALPAHPWVSKAKHAVLVKHSSSKGTCRAGDIKLARMAVVGFLTTLDTCSRGRDAYDSGSGYGGGYGGSSYERAETYRCYRARAWESYENDITGVCFVWRCLLTSVAAHSEKGDEGKGR